MKNDLPKLRRFEPVILQHGPNGLPVRVEKGWRTTTVETQCPLCNNWLESKYQGGYIESEENPVRGFVCEACARAGGLNKLGEGIYRIGGKQGYLWHWTPKSGGKRGLNFRTRSKSFEQIERIK